MTRADIPAKICPGCGTIFGPHNNEPPSKFAQRRHCSPTCANRRGARPVLHEPRGTRRLLISEQLEWQNRGACRTAPTSLREAFFAPDGEQPLECDAREDWAKAVCSLCPVRAECLAYALANNERHGVWGGLGQKERAALRVRPPDGGEREAC